MGVCEKDGGGEEGRDIDGESEGCGVGQGEGRLTEERAKGFAGV